MPRIQTYTNTFGSPIPTRQWRDSDSQYKFGFNGKEKDNEINVNGGDYPMAIGIRARIYASRLGRCLSLNPLMKKYSFLSAYCGMGNNPLYYLDKDGREIIPTKSFEKSLSFKVVQQIVNNLEVMPTLNKYFSVYMGLEKSLYLSIVLYSPEKKNGKTKIRAGQYLGEGKLNNKPLSIIQTNPIADVTYTGKESKNNYENIVLVQTDLALATNIIHELIFHASRKNGDHDITAAKLFDTVEALKEFSTNILKTNLSNEDAISMTLAGSFPTLPNFDALLSAANTKYKTDLTKETLLTKCFNLSYKEDTLSGDEIGVIVNDPAKDVNGNNDSSGEGKPIVKSTK